MEVAKESDNHLFWSTQPVPQKQEVGEEGPIDVVKTPEEIRATPYKLPPSFEWYDIDIMNDTEAEELYTLLLENYVEDDQAMFRFAYSIKTLRWALTPPGYRKEYHIAVRNAKTGKLLGFISGTPQTVHIRDKSVKMVDVNFLCVHKKIRSKRLAPVLIKELTRRVNRNDGWQAIYTAGTEIPTPVTKATYFHRALNPKKLIDIGFASVPSRLTYSSYIRFLSLHQEFSIPGFRRACKRDMPQVLALLNDYLKQFTVYPEMSLEEAQHYLLPQEDVIGSYVVENPETHKITDFISFFHIQSSVIDNKKYDTFTATYCYYYANTTTSLKDLLADGIIAAKNEGGDVFNALEVMNNATVFDDLKFARGDGTLHYYFYNWRLNPIKPSEMAVILP